MRYTAFIDVEDTIIKSTSTKQYSLDFKQLCDVLTCIKGNTRANIKFAVQFTPQERAAAAGRADWRNNSADKIHGTGPEKHVVFDNILRKTHTKS